MKGLFQKYADEYQFPWMLIAAEAYQGVRPESEREESGGRNWRDAGYANNCCQPAGQKFQMSPRSNPTSTRE